MECDPLYSRELNFRGVGLTPFGGSSQLAVALVPAGYDLSLDILLSTQG